MKTSETNRIIAHMMGDNTKQFLDAHWRRRISVVRNSLHEFHSFYGVSQFIEDYFNADFHAASFVIDVVGGRRQFTVPANSGEVSQALGRGASIALQALRLPRDLPRMPEKWKSMIGLHSALCGYFLSGFPSSQFFGAPIAAVDIFCSVSASTTGG